MCSTVTSRASCLISAHFNCKKCRKIATTKNTENFQNLPKVIVNWSKLTPEASNCYCVKFLYLQSFLQNFRAQACFLYVLASFPPPEKVFFWYRCCYPFQRIGPLANSFIESQCLYIFGFICPLPM